MNEMELDLPELIKTCRLILRPYRAGDGQMIYRISRNNREHLQRYESGNVIMSISNEEEAEDLARELHADWVARNCFFLGAFERSTEELIAQIYVGAVNWDLPEFAIGYFVDQAHEGQGFVSEAVQAVLGFVFGSLQAHRVRIQCDDTNLRSQHVAQRCGFKLEAHLRQNKQTIDGSYTGTLIFGLLRSEFYATA